MSTADSGALCPPAPVDAVTDRVKIFEAKLGLGTDAFNLTDFKGVVFLRLGASNSLKSATTLISLSNKLKIKLFSNKIIKNHKTIIGQRHIAIQITVYFNA